jgi:putative transposase
VAVTVSDFASRYLLCCEALATTQEVYAFTVFERVFKEFGLPKAIRTDNGVPFASAHALFGLSKLAVWWLRLGIGIERIKPGHPQQNGRHERIHLTLKKEATKPAAANFLQQQAKFDDFLDCYNRERPHQALGMPFRPTATSEQVASTPIEPTQAGSIAPVAMASRTAAQVCVQISVDDCSPTAGLG